MYTIITEPACRNDLVYHLKNRGIGASVHFAPAVHQHPYYKTNFPARIPLPNAEYLANSLVTLPMYPTLEFSEIDYIVQQIKNFFS